jgi:hypothetical protein
VREVTSNSDARHRGNLQPVIADAPRLDRRVHRINIEKRQMNCCHGRIRFDEIKLRVDTLSASRVAHLDPAATDLLRMPVKGADASCSRQEACQSPLGCGGGPTCRLPGRSRRDPGR